MHTFLLNLVLGVSILSSVVLRESDNGKIHQLKVMKKIIVSPNSNIEIEFNRDTLKEVLKESGLLMLRVQVHAICIKNNDTINFVVPLYSTPNKRYEKNYWEIKPLIRNIRFEGGRFISTLVPTAINLKELSLRDGDRVILFIHYLETNEVDTINFLIREEGFKLFPSIVSGFVIGEDFLGPFIGAGLRFQYKLKNPSLFDEISLSPSLLIKVEGKSRRTLPGFTLNMGAFCIGLFYHHKKTVPFVGISLIPI